MRLKTLFILLTPKRKTKDLPCLVFYENKKIKLANDLKFLSVCIHANLNFEKHRESIINKLRKYLTIFHVLHSMYIVMNHKSMMKLYYSNVFSTISDCLLLYA